MLLALPLLLGARPKSRQLHRWAPLAAALALFLLVPEGIYGTRLIYPRFGVFLLPFLLWALDPPRRTPRPLLRGLPAAVTIVWLLSLGLRFWGYNQELADLPTMIEGMQPQRRVLYLPLWPRSDFLPYPALDHSGLWYQVERSGMVDFSFSSWFAVRFQYPPAARTPEIHSAAFDLAAQRELYDYILVRSPLDPTRLFAGARSPIVLERRIGFWWLFRRGVAAPTSSWVGDAPGPSR